MPAVKSGLTITIETALSVGAGGSAGILADRIAIRDAFDRLIIPGSHVKGRLRHACEELARALQWEVCNAPNPATMCPQDPAVLNPPCIICRIFGSPAHHSPLRFNDLGFLDPTEEEKPGPDRVDAEETIRPGIGVNRRRSVVEEKLLFLLETSPAGVETRFRSAEAIVGHLSTLEQVGLLVDGLRFLRSWGGVKSRGLGWGSVDCTVLWDGQPIEAGRLSVKGLEGVS